MRQKERGTLTAETAGDPGSSDALDPGNCSRNSHHFRISAQCNIYLKFPWFFPLWGIAKGTSALGKSRNIQELLTDRIHRRYGMRDPCDSEESVRKTKDLMSDVKAWDESARTQWVFISGLAFNQISDPLFFSDSGVEQGSRIPYLRPVLSRKFWIFSGIS